MLQMKLPHRPQPLTHKDITHQLRQHVKLTELARWKSLETQSDVVRAISGAGSAFVARGGGLSDAEYRFALSARIDLAPTRSVLRRWNERGGVQCRHPQCTSDETRPHVLQHCPGNARAIDGRHDRVLAMIKAAIDPVVSKRGSRLAARFDSHFEGLPGRALRPDIQLSTRLRGLCPYPTLPSPLKRRRPTTPPWATCALATTRRWPSTSGRGVPGDSWVASPRISLGVRSTRCGDALELQGADRAPPSHQAWGRPAQPTHLGDLCAGQPPHLADARWRDQLH